MKVKEDLEPCVSCGNDTPFKKTDNIKVRSFFVEGAGQLCKKCYNIIYKSK